MHKQTRVKKVRANVEGMPVRTPEKVRQFLCIQEELFRPHNTFLLQDYE